VAGTGDVTGGGENPLPFRERGLLNRRGVPQQVRCQIASVRLAPDGPEPRDGECRTAGLLADLGGTGGGQPDDLAETGTFPALSAGI